MKRTGSMASKVGPLVTKARRPLRGASAPKYSSMAARISIGSAIRPLPNSPQARSPASGPIWRTPRDLRVAILAWVAGWAHIRVFIEGAISTGLSAASKVVEARSSASPWASLARRSALAGATTIRSDSRDRRIWPISLSSVREKSS